MLTDANWYSFWFGAIIIMPTSTPHITDNSNAFFINPNLRFENVTCYDEFVSTFIIYQYTYLSSTFVGNAFDFNFASAHLFTTSTTTLLYMYTHKSRCQGAKCLKV